MNSSRFAKRILAIAFFAVAAMSGYCQIGTWTYKSHMITRRSGFAAATGIDGRIYVFGGEGTNFSNMSASEVYDPASDAWSPIASMPGIRAFSAAVTVPDGRIFIFGGQSTFTLDSVLAYDPTSDTYATMPQAAPLGLFAPSAALGGDGFIHVIADNIGVPAYFTYDYKSDTWNTQSGAPASIPLLPAATSDSTGLIYLAGGQDPSTGFSRATSYSFNSQTDVWAQLGNLAVDRVQFGIAVGGDHRVYAVGGYQTTGGVLNECEALDPSSNTWSTIAALQTARFEHGVVSSNGKVYAIGGTDSTSAIMDTVECYQPNLLTGQGTKLASQEGQEYNGILGRFTDLDINQTAINFTASVSWGDGTPNGVASIVPDANPGTYQVLGDHTYAEAGSYTLLITLHDSDGEAVDFTTHLSVSDAPLGGSANNISPSVNIAFNGTVATLTDGNPQATAADYTGTVDWGDGVTDTAVFVNTGPGAFNINGSHTYSTQGSYQVKVSVNDVDGSKLSLTGSANVTIPPPHVTAVVITAQEGVLFNGQLATCTDDSPNVSASSFAASINWGDGTTTSGNVASNGSGGFKITGNHAYAEEGTFSITVTVSVVAGGNSSATGTASVTDAPISATGYSLIEKGLTFSDTVATFTDADPVGTASDYTAGIVWGDGKSSNGTIVAFGSGWKVVGSHSYPKRGKYTATIHIKDAGGATATATTNINVGPVK